MPWRRSSSRAGRARSTARRSPPRCPAGRLFRHPIRYLPNWARPATDKKQKNRERKMTDTNRTARLLAGTALAALAYVALPAAAQTTPATNPDPNQAVGDHAAPGQAPDTSKDIVVVGSQIKGSRVTTALPVTVIDAKQIDATGAVTGDDLIRAIPQMGEITFNPSNNPQTSNAARGDVNSINLRSLGVGNTLVLLNGRRLVSHPVRQAGEGNVFELGFFSFSLLV